jgi:hypothetical protein
MPFPSHSPTTRRNSEKIKEESVFGASKSRWNTRRDPIALTADIPSLLERRELDKAKQAKLLTEHLICLRDLPSTEEELL